VLFTAIEKSADMTPVEIRDNLATMKFDTVVGPLSFNSRHEARRVAYISEIKDGKFTTRATVDDPVLLAPPEKLSPPNDGSAGDGVALWRRPTRRWKSFSA
jgi:hypothetical protein